jgi:hypothetical protein
MVTFRDESEGDRHPVREPIENRGWPLLQDYGIVAAAWLDALLSTPEESTLFTI